MNYKHLFLGTALAFFVNLSVAQPPVFQSKAYTVCPDRVVQGKYTAKALSATELTSDYKSMASLMVSPEISFKFSINGKDNEMPSGKDHHFYVLPKNGQSTTPLIAFGHQLIGTKPVGSTNTYLQAGTRLQLRLDMQEVLAAFKLQGYYIGANGDKIYKNDFKGVFVAGSTAPMIWDFNNLVNHQELELKDPDGDGIYETTLGMNELKDTKSTASLWKLSKNISAFPQYHSSYVITDALYNLALEEMQTAVEPDSTFRTGKEWSGVWTRDISYSIILSMAVLQPKVAMYSLMRKVKDDRIIQDTGTGGAYPCSSDRMIWAVAAWEVYKVTGDKEWLNKAYNIIKKSAADDELNVYDPETGLVRGESSFLDWREQTYPRWMQPADIYESECLGTNAVHYQVNEVLAAMANLQHDAAAGTHYKQIAAKIRQGIQQYLWQEAQGYYGQYLYGRNYTILSSRSEALGEALAVYFNVADPERAKTVVRKTPVTAFGIPCIYPQIPGIPPYHNDAVWPFVETYWALASAKAGNEAAVLRAMSAVYRPAALFLTNKENFVSTSGDFAGTQINSSNMLWSLSGNIALVYKVLFGIHYNENSLEFKPFVPQALSGKRALTGFKYRDAMLNITMSGYGNKISTVLLDGKVCPGARLSANLKGTHQVEIILANNTVGGSINIQPDYTTVETPVTKLSKGIIHWQKVPGAVKYQIIKNGKLITTTPALQQQVNDKVFAAYQVVAVDTKGISSFASEPINVVPEKAVRIIEAENFAAKAELPYSGFSGQGFAEVSTTKNITLVFPVKVDKAGWYAIDFRYANGNGPINTENKCAIRTLAVDQNFAGTVVLPQRGKGEWSSWGFTNPVKVRLNKGGNKLSLELKATNTNMNIQINEAMVDYCRITPLF